MKAKRRWRRFRRSPEKASFHGSFFYFILFFITVFVYYEARSYFFVSERTKLYTKGGSLDSYKRPMAYNYL